MSKDQAKNYLCLFLTHKLEGNAMQAYKLALASALLIGTSFGVIAADPSEEAKAMCARWSTAFNAKDLNTQVTLYADDALRVAPDGYQVGSEAIRKAFTEDYKVVSDHHCKIDHSQSLGKDTYYDAGTWQVTLASEKGPIQIGGSFDGVVANGKIKLETWNLNPESVTKVAAATAKNN
jgi:ketosteroid isomerase-like protein